ncbi:hypothetical protein LOK49_LG05G01266 [Camellia lanceoleosa]|uniref:Uncharacterized protein n=1 Tax=Camellia lanceoleosa TaxID=1840588 RepID=A0ACC0HPM9_9ERIC|nr:hypothetical protein LOK49_LG05G01266 [Camellia lanceoleosa]
MDSKDHSAVGSSLVTGTLRRQTSGEEVGSRGTECSSNPSKLHRNASATANMNNLASQSSSANPGMNSYWRAIWTPNKNLMNPLTRPEVIPASEIGVTFKDIGALDDIKESLQELVMLPL